MVIAIAIDLLGDDGHVGATLFETSGKVAGLKHLGFEFHEFAMKRQVHIVELMFKVSAAA